MTPEEIRKQMMGSAGVDAAPQPQPPNPPDSRPALAWSHIVHMKDQRIFVTDGSLLIDASYASVSETPLKTTPESTVLSLLSSATQHEFRFDMLESLENARFRLPNGAVLKGLYVSFLSQISLRNEDLSLRAGGPANVVVLMDGRQVIGALMPMRA